MHLSLGQTEQFKDVTLGIYTLQIKNKQINNQLMRR